MNLHAAVRGAIQTVNPDQDGLYLVSTGYTQSADFRQVPVYATAVPYRLQVQALTGRELRHDALQNIQGVMRGVYMYGNTQGVVRVESKGGDLLRFAQTRQPGALLYTWKVLTVLETWTPTYPGWCKVAVVLQNDDPVAP